MKFQLNDAESVALKRFAGVDMRTDPLSGLDGFALETAEWREIHEAKKAARRTVEKVLAGLHESTPQDEARARNTAADALLRFVEEAEGELTMRKSGEAEARRAKRPVSDGGEARGVDDGYGGETRDIDAAESYALTREQRFADHLREQGRGQEFRSLGVGSYLRAMVRGPQNDLERRALASGTDSAGGYTVPEALSAALIDMLRARSVVFQTGARTVPLTTATNTIAKLASEPVPGWRAENAAIAESDPTFGAVVLQPKSLAVLVRVPRELLDDSVNINSALPGVLVNALASELDRVALLGSGAGDEPRGIVNFASLTANSFAGGALSSYAPLIKARTALRTANSDCTGFVMSTRDEGALAELTDSTGQPIQLPPAISNIPMLATSKMPVDGGAGDNESSIIAGDWSRLLIGMRTDIRVEVLRETFANNHQYGFVAHLRADIAAEHEGAFTVLEGITPAA